MTKAGAPSGTVPAWLQQPPSGDAPPPPVVTQAQELPLEKLSWKDFEKLCVRLVKLEGDIEYCQLFGEQGQDQEGIDLYGRLRSPVGAYAAYQAKRVEKFKPTHLKKAVDEFLGGPWAKKATRFAICTSRSFVSKKFATEFEEQTRRLKALGIELVPWHAEAICERLKNAPAVVDEFFDRPWTKAFCGEKAAQELHSRLDRSLVDNYRKRLGRIYSRVFSILHQGVAANVAGTGTAFSLRDRYVLPDASPVQAGAISVAATRRPAEQVRKVPVTPEGEPKRADALIVEHSQQARESIETWLANNKRAVVLGGPGAGKSALLSYIVLDLFSDDPRLHGVAGQWGGLLPLWIQFRQWSQLIARGGGRGSGLSDAVRAWLEQWGEGDVWPLVSDAIQDRRLLLIVDGLDEWASEESGRVGSELLQHFVETNDVSVIVTSRPAGFRRIPFDSQTWQVCELAELSDVQRASVAEKWFAIKAAKEAEAAGASKDFERLSRQYLEAFVAELETRTELDLLSRVPLFLTLLIYLKFQNAVLPRRRFDAYRALVDHLVLIHPMSKRIASSNPGDVSSGITPEEIRGVLAHVAFWMQRNCPNGIISDEEVRRVAEEYLVAEVLGVDQRGMAKKYASVFSTVAEGAVGILVRQSPGEVAFFHRSLQEYLAAEYASRLPCSKQVEIVEGYSGNPLWREVVLGLVWLAKRQDESGELVNKIRAAASAHDDVGLGCRELLAEVIFGEVHCPPSLGREIASDLLDTIRDHEWIIHRTRLLSHAVEGLRSSRLRDLVTDRIESWLFSPKSVYRPACFQSLAEWPYDALSIAVFKAGLNDEDPAVLRAAALSLASLGRREPDARALLKSYAEMSLGQVRRAATLEAYAVLWPEEVNKLIQEASESPSPVLRYAAIAARVRAGERRDSDRDALLAWSGAGGPLPYQWEGAAPRLLAEGWQGDPIVKQAALDTLGNTPGDNHLSPEAAYTILLRGFARDPDVKAHIVDEFALREHPLLTIHGHEFWGEVATVFRDQPDVVATVDQWIARHSLQGSRVVEVASISALGRTKVVKEALLKIVEGPFPHWGAEALLEHWGMEDPEVASALREIVASERAPMVGRVIPRVLPAPEARARILTLLADPDCHRHDMLASALLTLTTSDQDEEVIEALLGVPARGRSWDRYSALGSLVKYAPRDPRVREAALQSIGEDDAPMSSIMRAFKDDANIRRQCARCLTPLPTNLRVRLIEEIERRLETEDAIRWFRKYDSERDAEVKTRAAVAYCRGLKKRNMSDDAIPALRDSLSAVGWDYESRRQAALAGLVILERTEVVDEVRAVARDEGPFLAFRTHSDEDYSLFRTLAERWSDLTVTRKSQVIGWFDSPAGFWEKLSTAAREYAGSHSEVMSEIESGKVELTAGVLGFVSAVRPRSKLLLELCIRVMTTERGFDFGYREKQLRASQLYIESFPTEVAPIREALASGDGRAPFGRPALVDTLCAIAPADELVGELFERLRPPRSWRAPATAFFALMTTRLDAQELPRFAKDYASWADGDPIALVTLGERLLRRVRRDSVAREKMWSSVDDPQFAEIAPTLWRLLALTSQPGDDTLARVRAALRKVTANGRTEFAVDLLAGDIRAAELSLLDSIDGLLAPLGPN